MKKILILVLSMGLLSPLAFAAQTEEKPGEKIVATSQERAAFQARRKQIRDLIKKYKKAPDSEKQAIKEELSKLVSEHVDAQLAYMKERIAAERANLDNWEKKIQEDEKNLDKVKAQRVEDLISGEAQKKQKAARKAWKKQMKAVK